MIINRDIFNEVNWEAKGFVKGIDTLSVGGKTMLYFNNYGGNSVELFFDRDNWEEHVSHFEKEYIAYVGWSEYELYWGGLHSLATQYPPYIVTPIIWEEFLTIGGSKQAKRSWMYQKTGRRGLLTTLSDGTLYPKRMTRVITLNGVGHHVRYKHDFSQYIRFGSEYFSPGTTQYEIRGVLVPLPIIISRGNECETHGMYIGGECPVCQQIYQVHSYSTRAEHTLPFKDEGEHIPEYMGIELEYENCLTEKSAVYNALAGHVILKRDGSIHNGFEIVTAPATLASHKKAFSGFYSKVKLEALANCGMHVHVDKRKMGQMQLGKLLALVYKKENIPHLEKLAGRSFSTNSYCKAEQENTVTSGLLVRLRHSDRATRQSEGKYQAINTSPVDTIEFRIFAPPTDEKVLFARLELVQAMLDWTKPAVCSVKDAVSWEKFLEFVGFYKKSYPNLVDTLFGKKTQANVWVDEYSLAA